MSDSYRDLKHALRSLVHEPAFSAVVVLTLALGIGGNTAILSAAHAILFAPLPFRDSDALVRLRTTTTGPNGDQNAYNLRAGELRVLEKLGDSSPFTALVAMGVQNRTLTGGEVAERVPVVGLHGAWDAVLGIRPVQGRWFSAEEERRGADSGVAVISASLWNRRFAADRNAVGSSISLDNRIHAIVGVMPPGFRFPYDGEVWTPATVAVQGVDDYAVFARLKPGVTPTLAVQALSGFAQTLESMFPRVYGPGTGIKLWPMRDSFVDRENRAAAILASVGGFFLLLATFNVAGLVLSRSVMRRHEQQIRAALGAGRWHLVRRSLAETLVLSVAGGALGILLAAEAAPHLNALIPPVLSRQLDMSAAGHGRLSAALALALSLLSALAAGLLPAIRSASATATGVTATSSRIGRCRRDRLWMDAFVALEFALALALTAGAGLMLRNLTRLTHRDLGIDAAHLLATRVSATDSRYATADARRNLVDQLVRSAESAPGVAAAGVCTVNPLGGSTWTAPIAVEGRDTPDAASSYAVHHRLITPRAADAMGIQLLQGRWFTDLDNPSSPRVAMVSRRMARKYWPGDNALGKRVRVNRPNAPWQEVVGVVSDVEDFGDPSGPRETWYLPYAQNAGTSPAVEIVLMVRSTGEPRAVQHGVEQAIHAMNRDLALYDTSTMNSYYLETLSHQHLMSVLIAILAGFGLLLGALGIYGTLSLAIRERVREIGVRMALGATGGQIVAMILTHGFRIVLVAFALGLAGVWAVGKLLASQLSEVAPTDPLAVSAAAMLLLVIALVASWWSAREASRLDPLAALKRE